MRNIFIVSAILLVVFTKTASAQETCSSPEESLQDLNSITKCTIKPSKKTKNKRARFISVKVSAPKRRFLKKRAISEKNAVSSANSLKSSNLKTLNTNNSTEFTKTLELRKSVANLTNNLSAEEVRNASRFMDIDNIPTFKQCKGTKGDKAMDCFNTEMISHIQKHFNYPGEAIVKKIEGDVWVRFIIDKNGNVTNIKALGPKNGELLELEAKRVASKLPKFIPASNKGKTVASKYGFPINFSLNQ